MCVTDYELRAGMVFGSPIGGLPFCQDSAKGGAVETGCSDFHDVIHYFII